MTITLTREEAQQVLEALEHEVRRSEVVPAKTLDAAAILFAKLAQPEPEPVADKYLMEVECTKCGAKQDGILTVNVPPQREWQNAALRLGEELSTVGPNGYYNMTAQQWLDWAMKNVTPARISQPYKEQADAVFAETNGRMRIDPVTGNVGIGWASGPEKNGGA